MSETIDLIIRNARRIGADSLVDIAIKDDKIIMVQEKIKDVSKKEFDVTAGTFEIPFIDNYVIET